MSFLTSSNVVKTYCKSKSYMWHTNGDHKYQTKSSYNIEKYLSIHARFQFYILSTYSWEISNYISGKNLCKDKEEHRLHVMVQKWKILSKGIHKSRSLSLEDKVQELHYLRCVAYFYEHDINHFYCFSM